MCNERCRDRIQRISKLKYDAMLELIEKGELTRDALKGNRCYIQEKRAGTQVLKTIEPDKLKAEDIEDDDFD